MMFLAMKPRNVIGVFRSVYYLPQLKSDLSQSDAIASTINDH